MCGALIYLIFLIIFTLQHFKIFYVLRLTRLYFSGIITARHNGYGFASFVFRKIYVFCESAFRMGLLDLSK